MSERVDSSAIKPKIPDVKTGASGMPDRSSVSKNPASNPIFKGKSAENSSDVTISKPKLLSDNPKLAELGISLDKPLEVTPELAKKLQDRKPKGFWQKLKEGWTNAIPFGGTAIDMAKNINLLSIVKQMEKHGFESLSKEDRETLILFQLEQAEEQNRGTTFWGKVAQGLTHLPAFAVEFAVTGGLYSAGAKASQKILTTGLKVAAKKCVEQGVRKAGAKALGALALQKTAEVAAGSAMRATYGLIHRTADNAIKRQLDVGKLQQDENGLFVGEVKVKQNKESWVMSAAKGLTDNYIETVSEQSGAMFGFTLGKIPVIGKLFNPSEGAKTFMSKLGFNGIAEEFMEERFGGFLRGAIALDKDEKVSYWKNLYHSTVPTWEQTKVELATTAIWGGALRGVHGVYSKFKTQENFTVNGPELDQNGNPKNQEYTVNPSDINITVNASENTDYKINPPKSKKAKIKDAIARDENMAMEVAEKATPIFNNYAEQIPAIVPAVASAITGATIAGGAQLATTVPLASSVKVENLSTSQANNDIQEEKELSNTEILMASHKKIINYYMKHSTPQEITIDIEGTPKKMLSFRALAQNPSESFFVTDGEFLYKLENIGWNSHSTCLAIQDIATKLGFCPTDFQYTKLKGNWIIHKADLTTGEFVFDHPSVKENVYALNVLLNNNNQNISITDTANTADKPKLVFSRVSLKAGLDTLFESAKTLKLNKTEVISALKKIAEISDEEIQNIFETHNLKPVSLETILSRKEMLKEALDMIEITEQNGLPIDEYLQKIQIEISAKYYYDKLKTKYDTALISALKEEYGLSYQEINKMNHLFEDISFSDYLLKKLQKREMSIEDILDLNSTVMMNGYSASNKAFYKSGSELKIEIADLFIEFKKNYKLSYKESIALIYDFAQKNNNANEINFEAIENIRTLANKLLPHNIDETNLRTILNQIIEENGTINKIKEKKFFEILNKTENAQDAFLHFMAINTPNGFSEELLPTLQKMKEQNWANSTIQDTIQLYQRNQIDKEQFIMAIDIVIDILKKDSFFAKNFVQLIAENLTIEEAKLLKGELLKLDDIDTGALSAFLHKCKKSEFKENKHFENSIELMKKGVNLAHINALNSVCDINSKTDAVQEKTQKLYNLANQMLDQGYSSLNTCLILNTVTQHNSFNEFLFDFTLKNSDKYSEEELRKLLYFINIKTEDTEKRAEESKKQAEWIQNTLIPKGYSLEEIEKLIMSISYTNKYLGITAVNHQKKEFVNTCIEAKIPVDTIKNLSAITSLNINSLNLSKEEFWAKNKSLEDWALELLEKKYSIDTINALLNSTKIVDRYNRAYDIDEKSLTVMKKFVDNGAIATDFMGNLKSITRGLKSLNYDKTAIEFAKKYLKEEITLENGKNYKIDSTTLGVYIQSSRKADTPDKFNEEEFYKLAQLYILHAENGITINDVGNLFRIYKNPDYSSSLSTGAKIGLLSKLSYVPKSAINLIENKIIDTKNENGENIPGDIKVLLANLLKNINLSAKSIKTTLQDRKEFLQQFISNENIDNETGLNEIENTIANFDFIQYEKNGLPVKHSREKLITEIFSAIKDLTPEQKAQVLAFHNLSDLNENGFNQTLKVRRFMAQDKKLSQEEYVSIIKEVAILLAGINEKNVDLYKETSIDTLIEKCKILATLDSELITSVNAMAPDLKNIENIKEKAVRFIKHITNNEVHSLPTPIAVKIALEEMQKYQEFSPEMKTASQKIEKAFNTFVFENEFQTGNAQLDKIANGIMKGIPNFMLTIGKKQHGTHAYSVDIHTLEVLKKAFNDPEYRELSQLDKTILKFSILLHDFGKKYIDDKTPDHGHEINSAEIAKEILAQFQLPEIVKQRILFMVKNHNWFSQLTHDVWDANKVAALFRTPDDYKIARIMSKADLFSINSNFQYAPQILNIQKPEEQTLENASRAFDERLVNVNNSIANIYRNANILMNTKILNPHKIPFIEEVGVRVLNLANENIPADKDLGEYGLNGTTKDNLLLSVHMVDSGNLDGNLEAAKQGMENSTNDNNVWSISLLKMAKTRTYMHRKYGVITDVPIKNIAIASPTNLSSGYEKNIQKFVELMFSSEKTRKFLKNNFLQSLQKAGLEITDSEYQKIAKTIYNKQFLSQLKSKEEINVNGKIYPSSAIINAINDSTKALFSGTTHIELVVANPQIQGLVAKENSLADVPQEMITFARKYNLPILLIGNK